MIGQQNHLHHVTSNLDKLSRFEISNILAIGNLLDKYFHNLKRDHFKVSDFFMFINKVLLRHPQPLIGLMKIDTVNTAE